MMHMQLSSHSPRRSFFSERVIAASPLKFFTWKRLLAAAILLVLLIIALVWYFNWRSSSQFDKEYADYAVLAKEQATAAYLPASSDDPTRQQLDIVLSEALDSGTSQARRLQDAQQGLALITQMETEIAAIGDTSDKANTVIAQMQVGSADALSSGGLPQELISLAKQRSSVIEDIRGLSSRADFETSQIFQGIIAQNGALTPAYIDTLNDEIPQVETEFDQRTDLYTQLTSISTEMDQKAAAGLGAGYSSTASTTAE